MQLCVIVTESVLSRLWCSKVPTLAQSELAVIKVGWFTLGCRA
jgi:hypothetical protein